MRNTFINRIENNDQSAVEDLPDQSLVVQRRAIRTALKAGYDELACSLIEVSTVTVDMDRLAMQNGCFQAAVKLGANELAAMEYACIIDDWYDRQALQRLSFFEQYEHPRRRLKKAILNEHRSGQAYERRELDNNMTKMDQTVSRRIGRILLKARLDTDLDEEQRLYSFVNKLLQETGYTAEKLQEEYREYGADYHVEQILRGRTDQSPEQAVEFAQSANAELIDTTLYQAATNHPEQFPALFEQRCDSLNLDSLFRDLADDAPGAIASVEHELNQDDLSDEAIADAVVQARHKPDSCQVLIDLIDSQRTYQRVLYKLIKRSLNMRSLDNSVTKSHKTSLKSVHGYLFERGNQEGWLDQTTQFVVQHALCRAQQHSLGNEAILQLFYDAGGQLRSFEDYDVPEHIGADKPEQDAIAVLSGSNDTRFDDVRRWVDTMVAEQDLSKQQRQTLFTTLVERGENSAFEWVVDERGLEPDDEWVADLLREAAEFTYREFTTEYLLERHPGGETPLFNTMIDSATGDSPKAKSTDIDRLIDALLRHGFRPDDNARRVYEILDAIYDTQPGMNEAVENAVESLNQHGLRPPIDWAPERIGSLIKQYLNKRQQDAREIHEQ